MFDENPYWIVYYWVVLLWIYKFFGEYNIFQVHLVIEDKQWYYLCDVVVAVDASKQTVLTVLTCIVSSRFSTDIQLKKQY
jgi:hypothetical protein